MQVVRAGPDVHRDQRPEVDDGQAVGVDRATGLLGHEVIHHPEEAGGEEEAHGVVAVPPLDHRVGRPGVGRIRLEQAHRHGGAIDDVQHRGYQDECTEEPVTHIDVLGLAFDDGAEEHHQVGDPDDAQEDVDRPLELGVFLGAGVAHRQGDHRKNDDRLPTPEGEGSQTVGDQARLTGALDHVVRGREQCASAKGENHRVGVQRAQTAEARPR